jgi:uncharacterized Zn finger protein
MYKDRLRIPCPDCGAEISFSNRLIRQNRDFEIGCAHCKSIFSAGQLASTQFDHQGQGGDRAS